MLSFFFFASRRRHTRWPRDWSSDVCSSDLVQHRTPDLYRSVVAHVGVETSLTRGCAGRPGSVRGARTPLVHKSRVSLGSLSAPDTASSPHPIVCLDPP